MQGKTLDIFPLEQASKFMVRYPIPDDLKPQIFHKGPISWDDLLGYCFDTIKFLQDNKIHDLYTLEASCFEHIFVEIHKFYQNPSQDPEMLDKKMKLIKIEQDIHLITNISGTQDLSPYLKLIEEFCFDDRLDEIVSIVYWKHVSWYDGYGQLYIKLLNFLTPYFESLCHNDFQLLHLLEKSVLDEAFVQKCLNNLQNILRSKEIKDELELGRINETGYILDFLDKVKSSLVEKHNGARDNEFYYGLGICSFLHHLYKNAEGDSLSLVNVCILALTLRTDGIKDIKSDGEELVKIINNAKEGLKNSSVWCNIIEDVCSDFCKEELHLTNKEKVMHVLENALMAIRRLDLKQALLTKSKSSSKPLLLECFEVIENSNAQFLNGDDIVEDGFMNNSQYHLYLFVNIVDDLASTQGLIEREIQILLYKKVRAISNMKKLRPIIKDKCYSIMRDLASKIPDIDNKIRTNWNFSEIKLLDTGIIYSTISLTEDEDLSINLKFSLEFLSEKIFEEELEEKTVSDLRDIFKFYITQTSDTPSTSTNINKLKVIGLFLTHVLNLVYNKLSDIAFEFITCIGALLTQKSQMNRWEVSYLQPGLLGILQQQLNTDFALSEKTVESLIAAFEREISEAQFRTRTFLSRMQGRYQGPARDLIYKVIFIIIDDITEKMTSLFNKVNWSEELDSKKDKDFLELTLQCRRIAYFVIPWLDFLVEITDPSTDEKLSKKFATIFHKLCPFYFNPVFALFATELERDILDHFLTITSQNVSHAPWCIQLGFLDGFEKSFASLIDEKMESRTQEDLNEIALALKTIKFDSTLSDYLRQNLNFTSILPGTMKLQGIILGLHRIPMICALVKEIKPTYGEQIAYEELEKLLEKSLKALHNFILQMSRILQSDKEARDSELEKQFQFEFLAGIRNLTGLIGQAQNISNISNLVISFVLKLFDQSFGGANTPLNTFIFEITTSLLPHLPRIIEKGVVDRLIVHETILASLLQNLSKYVRYLSNNIGLDSDSKYSKEVNCIKRFLAQFNKIFIPIYILESYPYLKEYSDTVAKKGSHYILLGICCQLLDELEYFPIGELLMLGDPTLQELYKEFLIITEKFFISTVKSLKSAKEVSDDVIAGIEIELGLRDNLFSLFGDDECSSEELTAEQITERQLKLAECQKALTALTRASETLRERFYRQFSRYLLGYQFKNLERSDRYKMEMQLEKDMRPLLNELDNFNCRVINIYNPPKEYESVLQGERVITGFNDDGIKGQIIGLEVYLRLIEFYGEKLKNKMVISEIVLCNLSQSSSLLLEQILKEGTHSGKDKQNNLFETKLRNIVNSLTNLYLTCLTQSYIKDKPPIIPLTSWLELVHKLHIHLQNISGFNLIDSYQPNFFSFINLIRISLYTEPQLINILLKEKKSILKLILFQEGPKIWQMNTIEKLIAVFDVIFKGHLPSQTVIETTLMRAVTSPLESEKLRICDVLSMFGFDETTPSTSEESVARILLEKFSIDPANKDGQADPVSDFLVSLNCSLEEMTSQSSVQQILSQVSTNARLVLDTLLEAIVENYLHNVSLFSKQDNQTKAFKQTSSLMAILSTLLKNRKELLAYVLFNKANYHTQITQYQDSIYFLKEIDVEDFKSITVLDCLWKIKYFIFNTSDSLLWGMILGLQTGIIFKSLDNPKQTLDIAHLSNNWILDRMITDLQSVNSAQIDPMTLSSFTALLSILWTNALTPDCPIDFNDSLKGGALTLLKEILYRIKDYVRDVYKTSGSYGGIDQYLSSLLKDHYAKQLCKHSLKGDQVEKFKRENYRLFLRDNYDSLMNETKVHRDLVTLIETTREGVNTEKRANIEEYELLEEEKAYFAEKANVSIRGESKDINAISNIIESSTSILGTHTWDHITHMIEQATKNFVYNYDTEGHQEGERILMRNLGQHLSQNILPPFTTFQTHTAILSSLQIKFNFDTQHNADDGVQATVSDK